MTQGSTKAALVDEVEALRAHVEELESIGRRGGEDTLLRVIAEGTSVVGPDFFSSLVESLAHALHVRYALVGECVDAPTTRVRTLAVWMGDHLGDNFEYDIKGTPCEHVYQGETPLFPHELQELFPNVPTLVELDAHSYCGTPLKDVSGEIIGHLVVLHDGELKENHCQNPTLQIFAARAASELVRQRTEAQTRDTFSMLRTIINGATDVIFLQDLEGRYKLINPAGAASLGRTVEDVLGKYDHELFPPAEAENLRRENDQVVATGEPLIGEQAVSLQGQPHVFRTNKSPHRDVDGSVIGVIGVCRDVTESKMAEEKMHHAEKLASVGTLAAGIAHEINNPLSAILFSADTALSVSDDLNEKDLLKKCLEDISTATERAGRIVKSVLTFAGQQESTKESCDLVAIARRACDLTRHVAKQAGISVQLNAAENLPTVRCSPLEIEQVFVNLINNALDASEASSTIMIRIELEGDFVKVSVCDEGCGLTDEQKALIFDPFYTTRPGRGGTGLGLSITHGIVALHGGRIEVESTPDVGTNVCVTLPLD